MRWGPSRVSGGEIVRQKSGSFPVCKEEWVGGRCTVTLQLFWMMGNCFSIRKRLLD
jgi:hypothetical protein